MKQTIYIMVKKKVLLDVKVNRYEYKTTKLCIICWILLVTIVEIWNAWSRGWAQCNIIDTKTGSRTLFLHYFYTVSIWKQTPLKAWKEMPQKYLIWNKKQNCCGLKINSWLSTSIDQIHHLLFFTDLLWSWVNHILSFKNFILSKFSYMW